MLFVRLLLLIGLCAGVWGYRGGLVIKFTASRKIPRQVVNSQRPTGGKDGGGGGFLSFLKSDGPDFFDDEGPRSRSPAVKPKPLSPTTAATKPKPGLVASESKRSLNDFFSPTKMDMDLGGSKKASTPPTTSKSTINPAPKTVPKSTPVTPKTALKTPLKTVPKVSPKVVPKAVPRVVPKAAVVIPGPAPKVATLPVFAPPSSLLPLVAAESEKNAPAPPKAQASNSGSAPPTQSVRVKVGDVAPEFLREALAPAVDFYNDIVALPSEIERKKQETIKGVVETKEAIVSIPEKIEKKKQEVLKTVDNTVSTIKFVISLPGKVADTVSGNPRKKAAKPKEVFVVNAELNKVKKPESAKLNFEIVKEGIYRVGDAVEGTANLIQATGQGAVSAVQAVQRLPSDLERLGKTTTAKIEETKAGIDAVVSGIEGTAASVAAIGESIVRMPQTVEKKVVETQRSVESIKRKIAEVQDRLQGKPPVPKPKPPPKPPTDLERAVETAKAVGQAGVWGVTKGIEFVTWVTSKKTDAPSSTVPTSKPVPPPPAPPAKGLKTGTVSVLKTIPPEDTSLSTPPAIDIPVKPPASTTASAVVAEESAEESVSPPAPTPSPEVVVTAATPEVPEVKQSGTLEGKEKIGIGSDSKGPKKFYSPYKTVGKMNEKGKL